MAVTDAGFDVPNWLAGTVLALVLTAVGYVVVYGGEVTAPGLVVLGALGLGLGLFTLYLFYRFVVAVEKIADRY